ncbi:hypothetical protein BDF22DRAFT_662576 [Syncephalis plumigaleata]|nr:hypothetical protein BDF22DRAFT_662576 [Syncephalis plumigaleata]
MSNAIRRAASTAIGSIVNRTGQHNVQRVLTVHTPVTRPSYRSISILSTRHRAHQITGQQVSHVRLATTDGMTTMHENREVSSEPISHSSLPNTIEEITVDELFDKAVLPWERRHVGEWLVVRFQHFVNGPNTSPPDIFIRRFWAYGCLKHLLSVEGLWERTPSNLQEDIRVKTAYMCAKLWSGEYNTAEDFLFTEFFQHNIDAMSAEMKIIYANASRQLIRALAWEYADQNDAKGSARIEVRRQYWIKRFGHVDGVSPWNTNEPTVIAVHRHFSLFRHMLTKPTLSKKAFQASELQFIHLLEDTRRDTNFRRTLNFYNIYLRCQNIMCQLRERLKLFPDYPNADRILQEMKSDGITPNRFTYHLLMENVVYSQIPFPEDFDRAMSIARRMDVAGEDQRVSRTYELLLRTFPLSNNGYKHSPKYITNYDKHAVKSTSTGKSVELPTRPQGLKRLLSVESLMLNHYGFAHTTATLCAFWYRLAALGRFKEIQERWDQLSSAGVHLEREHYDTFLRVACRHQMTSSYALTVIFHQMQREVPAIPLDSGLLLGYLNCCLRIGDRQRAIQLLEAMQRRLTPIDGVARIRRPRVDDPLLMADPSSSRDWNNCLRPLTMLCKQFDPISESSQNGNAQQNVTFLAHRLRLANHQVDDKLIRLRELTRQVIIPPISEASSPYPRVRYYIDVEGDFDAAKRVIDQHVQAYKSDITNLIDMDDYAKESSIFDSEGGLTTMNTEDKSQLSTNPAYFVQVSRSYEKLIRSYLERDDLTQAKAVLDELIEHYLFCAPGLVNLVEGKRRGRPLVLPDWTILGDFALAASKPPGTSTTTITKESDNKHDEEHARWALSEALPKFEKAAQLRGRPTIPALPWIDEVEKRLGQRAASMETIL